MTTSMYETKARQATVPYLAEHTKEDLEDSSREGAQSVEDICVHGAGVEAVGRHSWHWGDQR